MYDTFCWKLRAALKSSGKTRREIGELLDLKPSTVKSWATGRRSPTVRRLLELAAVLGIAPAQLFDDTQVDTPPKVICEACGAVFCVGSGLKIHVAMQAKTCPAHASLRDGKTDAA